MDGREPSRMSSSMPPGMMVGANLYSANPMMIPNSDGGMPGIRLSFNPIVSSGSKPVDESSSVYHADSVPSMRHCGALSMGEPMKKKRGRPRKYRPDGNMSLALSPSGYSNLNGGPALEQGVKKCGRPPRSGRKQQLDALGSPGISFTPHVINGKAGEDVASKIMALSQQGPRTVCVLSANGAICNVTLCQPAISGGTVTYEGRFEIISMSGSFLLTENGGARGRTGGLSVALAGSDGRVVGGGLAGMLMAATTVQVVMGSFIAAEKKPKAELKREPSSTPPLQTSGFGAASSPPSQGSSSESDDAGSPGSPAMNPSGSFGTYNKSNHHGEAKPCLLTVQLEGGRTPDHPDIIKPRHDSAMSMMQS